MHDFDFHKNCWYIPVKSKEESLAAIEFLKTKGYEFENGEIPYAIDKFTSLTNCYVNTNKPHDYLLYGTGELFSREVYHTHKINLNFKYSVSDYVVEPTNKTLKQISDLEETIKILNEKIASLKKVI